MSGEPFGPFKSDCDPTERIAQLRVLRTLVHAYCDDRSLLEMALCHAESDAEAAADALALLDHLPALDRRRILATFAALHHPRYNVRRKGCAATEGNAHAQLDKAVR